jgi:hypothetical protein
MRVNWRAFGRSKDLWSGITFGLIGVAAVALGRGNPMGTAMRMGPAYFPTMLGGLLVVIGLAVILRAMVRPGPSVERFAFGKIALVLGGTLLFGLTLRTVGLIGSIVGLVLVSAFASARFRWGTAMLLAAGLALGSGAVFVWMLGLPIPLFGTWLGR